MLTFTSSNVKDNISNRLAIHIKQSSIFYNDFFFSCWFENFMFPTYFIYLSAASGCTILICITLILFIMGCSGYTISGSGYSQLVEIFAETIFFCIVVGLYFASAHQQTDLLLLVTAGAILLCGIYFFGANTLARTKIRNALICKNDSYFKGANNIYDNTTTVTTPTPNSTLSSKRTNSTFLLKPPRRGQRARPINGSPSADLTMDYINDHIHHEYRYPMNMWDRVGDGKRVRKQKRLLSDYALGSSDV